MTYPESESMDAPPVVTPTLLLQTVRTLAARLDPSATNAVQLRAIPSRGSDKPYGGYTYIQLNDPAVSGVNISGKLPLSLVNQVEWGLETVFLGVVDYQVRREGIVPQFIIGSIQGVGAARRPSKEDLRSRFKHLIERPRVDPESALVGTRPRIAIVSPATGVALDDIRQQLREAEQQVDISSFEGTMTQPEMVAKILQDAALKADLVVLTRGGGTGVDTLDADVLIEAVASCPKPTIVAVGHASDVLVLEQVANKSFPTPTAFGAWLRGALDRKRAQATQAAEARQIKEQSDLAKANLELTRNSVQMQATVSRLTRDVQLAELREKRLESSAKWLKVALVCALIIIVIVVVVLR
jgi:exodeoxyribonuclease VII large subunit